MKTASMGCGMPAARAESSTWDRASISPVPSGVHSASEIGDQIALFAAPEQDGFDPVAGSQHLVRLADSEGAFDQRA